MPGQLPARCADGLGNNLCAGETRHCRGEFPDCLQVAFDQIQPLGLQGSIGVRQADVTGADVQDKGPGLPGKAAKTLEDGAHACVQQVRFGR